MSKQPQLYGTWPSFFSSRLVSSGTRLNDVRFAGDALVWAESRGGRGVICVQRGSDAAYELSGDASVRGRVGYGGGELTTHADTVYYAADGRIYKQALDAFKDRAITPAHGDFAAPAVSPDGRWLAAVHSAEGRDTLALVSTDGDSWPRTLISGTDFVMQPAWHPDSRRVACVVWDHPNMPWDGTRLLLLTLDENGQPMDAPQIIAGGDAESVLQPEFSPDGRWLAYISDRTGIGQIYLHDLETGDTHQLTHADADHGGPAWVQGMRLYAWTPDSDALVYRQNAAGFMSLWRADLSTATHAPLTQALPYGYYAQVSISARGEIAVIAASPQHPRCVLTLAPDGSVPRIHARAYARLLPENQLATAQAITWTGHDGETVHGLYYAPTHPHLEGVGAPPLIVDIHGGPTSQTVADFDAETQFYATRGYAVLAVNYRGSTGYGRDYMNMLRENWGVYDVEDAASGVKALAQRGLAQESQVAIMGGSAGGYTVLQSLVDKPGVYRAGVCLYGISNQFMLVEDTHKFEARYSDSLLGALPQAREVYKRRSPLFEAHKISDPLLVFQGADDVVVPQNQSDVMVEMLRGRGVPVEYHVYAGEGHGFRKPENIDHYLTTSIKFLKQHLVYA